VHEAALLEHLRTHSLRLGDFTLRSGARSNWYMDARTTTFDGAGALLVARAVLEVLVPQVSAVGGPTQGADPIGIAVAVVASTEGRPLKAFSVRKEAKGHGTGGRVVGPVVRGDKVAVVEDTTTTGGSLLSAIDALGEEGIAVVQALTLVDRSGGSVAGLMKARGIPYLALVVPADLGLEP
jgi:orotate phosphoribosyltransferase